MLIEPRIKCNSLARNLGSISFFFLQRLIGSRFRRCTYATSQFRWNVQWFTDVILRTAAGRAENSLASSLVFVIMAVKKMAAFAGRQEKKYEDTKVTIMHGGALNILIGLRSTRNIHFQQILMQTGCLFLSRLASMGVWRVRQIQ